jgi:hypothetical protein
MTANWTIYDVKYQTTDGLVISVTYGYVATLESIMDRHVGQVQLQGDPTSSQFIPYEQLTPETVVQWVKSSLGQEQVSQIETQVQNAATQKQAAREAQTIKSGLPWA